MISSLRAATGLCVVLVSCLAPPLAAETVNCDDPIYQYEMNQSAQLAWERADEDLNLAYQLAVAKARQIDAFAADSGMERAVTTEDTLRVAQRAWITFRDNACAVESHIALGGSMAPLLYSTCLEALTQDRTEQLRFFGEVN